MIEKKEITVNVTRVQICRLVECYSNDCHRSVYECYMPDHIDSIRDLFHDEIEFTNLFVIENSDQLSDDDYNEQLEYIYDYIMSQLVKSIEYDDCIVTINLVE